MSNQESRAKAALDELVRIFADTAIREVEAKLAAEEKAGEPPDSAQAKQS